MRKTAEKQITENNITVGRTGLKELLNCGEATAEKIAVAAGAKIKVGRRTLYHVGKIEAYLDQLANEQEG